MGKIVEEPFGLTAEERSFVANQLHYTSTYKDLRGITPDTVQRLIGLVYRLHSQLDREKLVAAESARQVAE